MRTALVDPVKNRRVLEEILEAWGETGSSATASSTNLHGHLNKMRVAGLIESEATPMQKYWLMTSARPGDGDLMKAPIPREGEGQ